MAPFRKRLQPEPEQPADLTSEYMEHTDRREGSEEVVKDRS